MKRLLRYYEDCVIQLHDMENQQGVDGFVFSTEILPN